METQTTHPSKEAVRRLLQQRRADHTPPPTPERIREQLGWHLLTDNKPHSR
ncbi:hypothetical protein [Duganella aquatilis]|uniref:hypothetical protein n=1 Tax=Duganella aquatilis TaxID=2666082 RepID=UPI00140E7520|nr:hypothetical protein [Duganella aquatilis]